MLILPIKKKWFDMILSGKKTEEYRDIKPYYTSRICKEISFPKYITHEDTVFEMKNADWPKLGARNVLRIQFRNGYRRNSPSFAAKCSLSIGTGREEWGAERGKEYFVLTVQEIIKEDGLK